jgi:hypothetical protein
MKALCEKCPDGGFMNELGLCQGCIANCYQCNARGTCTECSPGYYWSPNANTITLTTNADLSEL